MLAVVLFAASTIISSQGFGSSGDAELLREIDDDPGTLLLTFVLRAAAVLLLAVPTLYLFKASQARSDRVRGQLVGVVVAGPAFLAVSAVLTGIALHEVAPDFVAKGVMGNGEHADDVARNIIEDASVQGLALGFGFAGGIGFAVAVAYSALNAVRTGLLPRFWGTLGMALGVVSLLPNFFLFLLLWFVYLGLIFAGWFPGGRPPAWAAGEAIPWPAPGEEPTEAEQGEAHPAAPGSEAEDAAGNGSPERGASQDLASRAPSEGIRSGSRRKRKRRR
ncbi:MAG: hypothetical protein AABM29_00480 [Actinomycetota bacterium]